MTFLNTIMLLGLAAVAIPIIIHILNRRKARVVEWGAMIFLEASVASRNRRVLIEEILLMALRCLLLAMLVLALARPFVLSGRMLAGHSGDAQDIALVIDGSLSMTLDNKGKSNFQRAVAEAKEVLDVCRSGDAVSLILAGPTAQSVVPTPIADHLAVRQALDELSPPRGCMSVLEALQAANSSLAAGNNPVKKIILITDGQRNGWELSSGQRWSFLAQAAAALPTAPTVLVRTLELPKEWHNAAIAAMNFSRAVIGPDRPVRLTVTVANTGVGSLTPEGVELSIDGKVIETRTVGAIAEGASSTAIFDYQFTRAGPHIVEASVACEDDLPGDNRCTRVVDVLKELPVLVVEGQHSARPLESDSDFLMLALAPPPEDADKPARRPPASAPTTQPDKPQHLIHPTVVQAADIGSIKKFDDYAVIILADAPRLPAAAAKAIQDFVINGGGLLVAPGEKADKDFYKGWTTLDRKRVLGCELAEIRTVEPDKKDGKERFVHVSANSIDHPALKLLADPSVSDLASAQLRRRWLLTADKDDARESQVSIGATLDNGEPFLIQRKVGKGLVLTLSGPLDRQFSDLPVHESYVPMVHELVSYLAAPSQRPMNLVAGQQFVYAVPGAINTNDLAEVLLPDGKKAPAKLSQRERGGKWQAAFGQTAATGLYRLLLPEKALGELASRPAVTTNVSDKVRGVPFVVLDDPEESKLDQLNSEDFARANQFVHIARAETLGELTAAIVGKAPGSEIWRYLALAVLALLTAEILATRAITMRRQAHLATPVAFGTGQVDVAEFRKKAKAVLAPPPEGKRGDAVTRRRGEAKPQKPTKV